MTSIDHDAGTATSAVGITAASMDLTGRHYLLVILGEAPSAAAKAKQWARALHDAQRSISEHTASSAATVGDLIASSTVGIRIMICGPEFEVMQAVAAARSHGVLPCEMFVHITHVDAIHVYCPHCDTATRTIAQPNTTAECSGCRRDLLVRPHTSSHRAMYLASVA
ncbi:hypothetical protein JWS13_30365 [Rhodococcus pseudokoreensis]|uniref:Dimethylamine monooxygenase subunit DmmA-like C-terminal domain-containing protein n=1 Tax=Rhodococcus pseudokoreensis TaxID=2811421 RepID=A0A974W7D8_9NOCA|nr:dimethylamine monooxygenase subunit DmmA family protein [Rhodococcus pseudokoreensis]QSE92609.1 hypothetical protein JWS13_30365 [Rhodococcus pseudokoreensis]